MIARRLRISVESHVAVPSRSTNTGVADHRPLVAGSVSNAWNPGACASSVYLTRARSNAHRTCIDQPSRSARTMRCNQAHRETGTHLLTVRAEADGDQAHHPRLLARHAACGDCTPHNGKGATVDGFHRHLAPVLGRQLLVIVSTEIRLGRTRRPVSFGLRGHFQLNQGSHRLLAWRNITSEPACHWDRHQQSGLLSTTWLPSGRK